MSPTTRHRLTGDVDVGAVQTGLRIEEHARLGVVLVDRLVEATVRRTLVGRLATADRLQEALTAQAGPLVGALTVGVALLRVQRGDERLRVHHRDQSGHVTEAEAGQQTRLEREPLAELEFDYMPGDVLPVEFGVTDWQDYQTYGLTKAVEGTEWVRVDDDAVLINQRTGEIIYVAYDLDARRISS